MKKNEIEVIEVATDVLIIGGGLAGCMAAIKASESGLRVTIAEKANTLASGCAGSGIDHMWAYIPEVHGAMGYSMDDMMENHTTAVARGFVNQDLLRLVVSESYGRMLDLEKFGLKFRYEDSKVPGKFRVVDQFHSMPDAFNFEGRRVKVNLTKEAKRRGVRIINRVTMTELLASGDGHVTGALGAGTRDGKLYHFKANAVVMSTGRVNRLCRSQTGVWGNHRVPVSETGDGRAMAFRAGVPIINMEFLSPARFSIGNFELNLGSPRNTVQPAGSIVDGQGRVIVPRVQFYDWDNLGKARVDAAAAMENQIQSGIKSHPDCFRLIQEGQGPFYLDLTGGTEEEIRYIEWSISHEGKGPLFLEHLQRQEHFDFRKDKLEWLPNSREMAGTASSGLVVDSNLETGLKGLFAAGDEVGGMPWSASPGAFTMGWRAGENAALEAAEQKGFTDNSASATAALGEFMQHMTQARHGQHWREAETAVQNIVDYYASNHRSEHMLQRGLTRLNELSEVINFKAENPHEAGHCLEIRSLIENAEMVMRASIERKESRKVPFGFLRADYPEPDNAEYFAFLSQQLTGKTVRFAKIALQS
jgi:succinate dehydrogenase/fumarate reductase flavoprotein subunit